MYIHFECIKFNMKLVTVLGERKRPFRSAIWVPGVYKYDEYYLPSFVTFNHSSIPYPRIIPRSVSIQNDGCRTWQQQVSLNRKTGMKLNTQVNF